MLSSPLAGPLVEMLKMLGGVLAWLWRERRPPAPRPVGVLAELLAKAVSEQWRQEADKRMLLTPAPIPVGWSRSELAVTGPEEAAIGDPEVASAFPPLPGQPLITAKDLRVGGGRRELFAVYAGIASGRVVVLGSPGAGKTGSAVLLVRDALEHRAGIEDTQRVRVPVPVLLTAYGWDPFTCPARVWLADQLVASYPQLFARRGGRDEARALVAEGAVTLVLDGLDEMDLARRPVALKALRYVPCRVVVLTRSKEMVQAADVEWLVGACALQLRAVTGPEGADYLHRALTGPPPLGWAELLTHLRNNPDSVLTRGLSTPLALTLIRDTYRRGDDLSDLLTTDWSTVEDLERYLIGRVLPAAYTRQPGQPAPRYSPAQAEQVLVFLARQMDDNRDLAWWQIPQWVPATPRILASMLAGGILGGALGGLVFGVGALVVMALIHKVAPGLLHGMRQGMWITVGNNLLIGLAFGFGIGFPLGIVSGHGGREPKRVRKWKEIGWGSVLTAGLGYGLAGGSAAELMLLLVIKLAAIPDRFVILLVVELVVVLVLGLAMGLTFGLSGWRGEGQGSSQQLVTSRRQGQLFGLMGGVVLGLTAGVMAVRSFHLGLVSGLAAGLAALLVFRLVSRLAGGAVAGLAVGSADSEPGPQGPRETWCHDRAFRLRAGLVFGLGVGLGYGVGFVLAVGFRARFGLALVSGLTNFLLIGLSVALVYGITSSVRWSTTLAWRQLRLTRRVPAVALMPFLEDARARGVLRTVGAVYQFRHATLQDALAGQANHHPATARAVSPPQPPEVDSRRPARLGRR